MSRKPKLPQPPEPADWSARLDEVLKATGWGCRRASSEFRRSWSALKRVLQEGKTKNMVGFIVRLKELEGENAGAIAAYRAGIISYVRVKGRKQPLRFDFRARVRPAGERVSRPADLQALGAVGGSVPVEGDGHGGVPEKA